MSTLHYFVGLGCKRGCSETSLRNVLQQALSNCGLSIEQIDGIASIEKKADEVSLLELAKNLAIPLSFFPAEYLNSFADEISASSASAIAAVGVVSVAEASALALAKASGGDCVELVGKKQNVIDATCAIARVQLST